MIHCCQCGRSVSWRRLPGQPKRFAYTCRVCGLIYDSRSGKWLDLDEFAAVLSSTAAEVGEGEPC